MEQFISQILGEASGGGAYSLVFLVLLGCGLGVPLPEDMVLITGGFLVFKQAAGLETMLAVAFAGILGGDSIAFFLGRKFGDGLQRRWPFRLFITPAKRRRVEGLFARYGEKIVMAARFMPGVRAVTFFLAGGAGMRYLTFILFDGLAALVSAPLFVLLGYHFGANIEWVIHAVRRGQGAVIGAVVVASVLFLVFKFVQRRRCAATAPPPAFAENEMPGQASGPKRRVSSTHLEAPFSKAGSANEGGASGRSPSAVGLVSSASESQKVAASPPASKVQLAK